MQVRKDFKNFQRKKSAKEMIDVIKEVSCVQCAYSLPHSLPVLFNSAGNLILENQ